MSFNIDMPYPDFSESQSHLEFSPSSMDRYGYFQLSYNQENYTESPLMRRVEEYATFNPEVSSSSDARTGRRRRPLTQEEREAKLQQRRMQNRVAAARCRQRKEERLAALREGLKRMHDRSIELWHSIDAVETELRNLKAAGYGLQVAYAQYHSMNNGTSFNGLEEPLQFEEQLCCRHRWN